MAYKISGSVTDDCVIAVFEAEVGTLLNKKSVTAGNYEIDAPLFVDGEERDVIGVAIKSDGHTVSYGKLAPIEYVGDRIVWASGSASSSITTMDYSTVSTTSNATVFGDSSHPGFKEGTSNGSYARGIIGDGSPYARQDSVNISIPGNSVGFGTLYNSQSGKIATSNTKNDRAIWMGGASGSYFNHIDYHSISVNVLAADFGDLWHAKIGGSALSNGINNRGIYAGANDKDLGYTIVDDIEYITISTLSNGVKFGDLTVARVDGGGTSNDVNDRGIVAGGKDAGSFYNTIDYFTISVGGTATDFGDLITARNIGASDSNGTNDRAIFAGGYTNLPTTYYDDMEYVTISTPGGTANSFGNLTEARNSIAACSNS